MRDPDGNEFPNPGVYLELVPNRRIVFTDAYGPGWLPSAKPFMTAIVTFDPEGDSLTFDWWVQKEISSPVEIANPSAKIITVTIPENAAGKTHIVCEVHDNGAFNLVAYRRVVIRL